jgi:O-antigen/teichoic acid export membrane protein
VFRSILNTFGTKSATAVINLLIAIALSRYLGAAGKGEQSLIITTVAFILVFANLVGGATLVYLTPRHRASVLLIPSYIWTLFISILAYLVLAVFHIVDKQYILHICILSLLNSYVSIHSSILIGKEKIAAANLLNLVQPVITVVVLIILFMGFKKTDISAYIISLYLAFGISLVISVFMVIKWFGRDIVPSSEGSVQVVRDLIRFGFLNQVAHITQMLSFRLSYYVLDHFRGEAQLGVYSNGISLAESIWLISKSISMVQYARIANSDDKDYARELTVRLIKGSLAVSVLLLVPLVVFPPEIYRFVFGPEFGDVRNVIWTLAAGVLIYNISILTGHYFSGTGKYYVNALTSTLGLIVSVALYYTMIPAWGIYGAGFATSISYIFTSGVLVFLFYRESGSTSSIIRFGKEDIEYLKREMKELLKRK